jgi:hypothetical protein
MARKIEVINNQIIANIKATPALAGLTSDSTVAIWRLFTWIVAVAINLLEQVIDISTAAFELLLTKAGVGTAPWIRDRVLEFQSGDNVTYTNGKIYYATVDTTKQIITRVSVTQDSNKQIKIKVAKSEPPVALSNTEISELKFYGLQIHFEGTVWQFTTGNSDKLYVLGTVYYNGQFAANVQANVIAALDAYCSSLSSAQDFDGTVLVSAIETVILSVPGVNDVNISQIAARADSDLFSARAIIYDLPTGVNLRSYTTNTGYIVQETTAGETFTDSLTFTAQ